MYSLPLSTAHPLLRCLGAHGSPPPPSLSNASDETPPFCILGSGCARELALLTGFFEYRAQHAHQLEITQLVFFLHRNLPWPQCALLNRAQQGPNLDSGVLFSCIVTVDQSVEVVHMDPAALSRPRIQSWLIGPPCAVATATHVPPYVRQYNHLETGTTCNTRRDDVN